MFAFYGVIEFSLVTRYLLVAVAALIFKAVMLANNMTVLHNAYLPYLMIRWSIQAMIIRVSLSAILHRNVLVTHV